MTMRRRHFLATAGLALLAGLPPARAARGLTRIADIVPAGGTIADPTLLVAGNADSVAGKWGTVLSPALAQGLDAPRPVSMHLTSGQDGVTGANLFDTQTVPDGTTALLVPGAALVASLAGDPRAHFDFGRWVPLMLSLVSPVVVGRAELHRTFRDLMRDRPVRIAVSADTGVELATVLAMALFGLRPIPVAGFASRQDALAALRDGKVDVVQVSDPMSPQALAAMFDTLGQSGAAPLFTLSDTVRMTAQGHTVPTLAERFAQERGHPPDGLLYEAWKVVAAAASLDVALVLPMLTPPAQVAGWRHAMATADAHGAVDTLMNGNGRKLVTGTDCAPHLRDMTGETSAVLTLRRWLASHAPNWRLG
ncbi:conserved hypothetical protein [Gluconacetobacter diazotrophicus PA1 5]|uniref:Uncharacterized protein n=2 Tax=Gluconacetobacter diazotrophicus TaxID=33996 RepID=A9HK68_GLUDA|nr:hypothetical protein [Gluconacetobacter diazotrophicus]ACI50077.1 conserved hypothetical protein [Gluconacetobacter diazotrophicus PA1 5]MBB2156229.1 hypothetical protein [Gluconacetobacter diazotrophicus]TWB07843.1 hypothetical protein FBZ86_10933 [Gluconacetobacter diazotrophicus]CAP56002.1 hypothetical protein GDI2059 [Gluconacetobacter diazotrophicus PA1 5]